MAPLAGLLWGRVYAMSRHNEGMRRVIGALGPLLYMGSLGAQVVRTLFFTFKSGHYSILKHNMLSQFLVVKDSCGMTGWDLGPIRL
jgi:hypothetical protein